MKYAKIFSVLAILAPMAADAASSFTYQVEQTATPAVQSGHDSQAFARNHRFYVGASYNFAMWDGYTDDADVHVSGRNTSSFDVSAGLRLYDVVRLDLNYTRTRAEWNQFSLDGDMGLLSVILDGRIDNMYRIFRTQRLIPYVGAGAGLNWNSSDDIHFDTKITPVVAAMAGIGFEMGENVALDFGYRYLYMFTPKFDGIHNLAPTAHQFRAGIRINL